MNAVDPVFNMSIFDGASAAGADYLDMAMSLSKPHPEAPYEKTGVKLGDEQFAVADEWESSGRLALVGIGVEPGLSDVFARYAADHLFSEIDELGTRDGANLVVTDDDGNEIFAPSFSMWTTIEECLNPPVIWEQDRGWFTTPPFSEPEVFDFPEGIGPVECVNVEHEEVLLMPRWVDCKRATFKYGLGDEFINILKVLHTLGLDSTEKVRVKGVEVSPRDVVAAVLPDPATVGPRMKGKTCAGLWVTGTGKDGAAAVDVPLSRGRQRVDDAGVRPPVRGLADRDQPGRRARAARARHLERCRRARARRRSTRCRSSTCSPSTAARGGSRSADVTQSAAPTLYGVDVPARPPQEEAACSGSRRHHRRAPRVDRCRHRRPRRRLARAGRPAPRRPTTAPGRDLDLDPGTQARDRARQDRHGRRQPAGARRLCRGPGRRPRGPGGRRGRLHRRSAPRPLGRRVASA